jgi:hypothetical protein
VLGVLVLAYTDTFNALSGTSIGTDLGQVQLRNDQNAMTEKLNAWEQGVSQCGTSLSCATRQAAPVASALRTFSGQLSTVSLPSRAAADRARSVAATNALERDFAQLSRSANIGQYDLTADSPGFQQAFENWSHDVTALDNDLGRL